MKKNRLISLILILILFVGTQYSYAVAESYLVLTNSSGTILNSTPITSVSLKINQNQFTGGTFYAGTEFELRREDTVSAEGYSNSVTPTIELKSIDNFKANTVYTLYYRVKYGITNSPTYMYTEWEVATSSGVEIHLKKVTNNAPVPVISTAEGTYYLGLNDSSPTVTLGGTVTDSDDATITAVLTIGDKTVNLGSIAKGNWSRIIKRSSLGIGTSPSENRVLKGVTLSVTDARGLKATVTKGIDVVVDNTTPAFPEIKVLSPVDYDNSNPFTSVAPITFNLNNITTSQVGPSGVAKYEYQITQQGQPAGAWTEFKGPFVFNTAGDYSIKSRTISKSGNISAESPALQFSLRAFEGIEHSGDILIELGKETTKTFAVKPNDNKINNLTFTSKAPGVAKVESAVKSGGVYSVKLKGLSVGETSLEVTPDVIGQNRTVVVKVKVVDTVATPVVRLRGLPINATSDGTYSVALVNKSAVIVESYAEMLNVNKVSSELNVKQATTFKKVAEGIHTGYELGYVKVADSYSFNNTLPIYEGEFQIKLTPDVGSVQTYGNRNMIILDSPYRRYYTTSATGTTIGSNVKFDITLTPKTDNVKYRNIVSTVKTKGLPNLDVITVGIGKMSDSLSNLTNTQVVDLAGTAKSLAITVPTSMVDPYLIFGNPSYGYEEKIPLSGDILQTRLTNIVTTGITSTTQFTPKAIVQYNGFVYNIPNLTDTEKFNQDGLKSEVFVISDAYMGDVSTIFNSYKTKLTSGTMSSLDNKTLYEALLSKLVANPTWTANSTGIYSVSSMVDTLKDVNIANSGNYIVGLKSQDNLGNVAYDMKLAQLQLHGSSSDQVSVKGAPNVKLSNIISDSTLGKMETLGVISKEGNKLTVHGIKYKDKIYVSTKATTSGSNLVEIYDLNLIKVKTYGSADLGMTSIYDFAVVDNMVVGVGKGTNNLVVFDGVDATSQKIGDGDIYTLLYQGSKLMLGSSGDDAVMLATLTGTNVTRTSALKASQIYGASGKTVVSQMSILGSSLLVSDGSTDAGGSAYYKYISLPN